jgi:hypothetical protein
LASRRRRRKSIGKVIVDAERRIRRIEKRPGARRLKNNVVTTEKIGYRAVRTKYIDTDAVTANEAEFGVTVVSNTDPDIVKEGTTVVDPDTGAQKVYSTDILDFVPVTDPAAQATADSKSATYYQDNAPTGGTYQVGDIWIDTNDNDKLYTWDGTTWSLTQDSASAASAAQVAYNAAIASLQPSASTIVNASNQITAVNTNGITVYSGSSPSSGARIVMNSLGLAGFDSTSTGPSNGATFSISASTGAAVFKGSIQSGSTITGAGITGSTFTSTNYTSGTGLALAPSGSGNSILFNVSGSQIADITTVSTGLVITSGSAQLTMTTAGAVILSSLNNSITLATAPFLNTSGANTSGAYGSLRNTFASSAAPTSGDGVNGDVWLRWA